MKINISLKSTVLALASIVMLSFSNLIAQDTGSTSHNQMMGKNHKHMMDSTHMNMRDSASTHMMKGKHKMHDMKKGKMNNMKHNPIVHEGMIDLMKIDKNNDGKVYQDMMDWNVISDKPGECPVCGMKLKEVTIDQAKKNLKEHNFKTK